MPIFLLLLAGGIVLALSSSKKSGVKPSPPGGPPSNYPPGGPPPPNYPPEPPPGSPPEPPLGGPPVLQIPPPELPPMQVVRYRASPNVSFQKGNEPGESMIQLTTDITGDPSRVGELRVTNPQIKDAVGPLGIRIPADYVTFTNRNEVSFTIPSNWNMFIAEGGKAPFGHGVAFPVRP